MVEQEELGRSRFRERIITQGGNLPVVINSLYPADIKKNNEALGRSRFGERIITQGGNLPVIINSLHPADIIKTSLLLQDSEG